MADQNFMDLASKTASGITGTDYMMLVNNSEAYKALVNDVAEAILGKLTSKSFSGLETTAKNVIGALNELNSNKISNTNSINRTKMSLNDITDNFVLIESSYITDMPEEISSSMSSWILIITFKVDASHAGVQFVTSLFNATELNLKIFKRRLSEGAWNEFKQIN